MEHSHSEKGILDSARTRFLAADFVVAGVQADPHFQTSYFPVAVGSAAVAAGLKLRLGCQTDRPVAEAAAAADFEIVHHPAVAAAAELNRKARPVVEAAWNQIALHRSAEAL